MATIANLEAILRLDDQMTGQLTKSAGALSKLGTVVSTAGGFLLAQGAIKVAQGIGGMVTAGMDFETQMANVNSIAQLSATELQNLSGQVLALTNNPGITDGPAALAAGLYDIASAGFTGQDGLTILQSAAIGAAAGVTTTAVAANALTSVLGAYGLGAGEAAHVTDLMFQTVNDGKISFEQLASNLGNVLPLAASAGVGFEQLGAAFAQMTLQGINATQAETQIASLMKSALNPTAALTDAVGAHGYASAQAALESEGLAGFLGMVMESADGNAEALFDMLGTQEAVNAALALGSEENLPAFIEQLERMGLASEGAGAAQKALDKQMQSSSFAIAKAKQQLQVLAVLGFGMISPAIQFAARSLTRFISEGLIPFGRVISSALRGGFEFRELVEDLPQPLRRIVGAFASVTESVGDVVRSFGDRGLSGAIRTLTTGGELAQIGTAFRAIGQEAWNAAVAGFNAIPWGTIWDLVTSAIGTLPSIAQDIVFDLVPKLGEWLWDTGGDLISWAIGHLPGTATRGDGTEGPAGTNAASTVDVVLDLAAQLGRWIWGAGTDLVSWAKSTIEETITIDNIKAAIDVTADTLNMAWGGFSDAAGWVYSKITKVINVENIKAAVAVAADTLDMTWGGFEDAAGWVYSKIEKSVTVDIVANFLIEAGTGTMAPGADATLQEQAQTLIEGVINPVPVKVSPEFRAGVVSGSADFTGFLLSGGWFRVDADRIRQAWMVPMLGAINPAGLMGTIIARFTTMRLGGAVADIIAASFEGASGPVIGAIADLGVAIEQDLGRLQDGIRNQLNQAGQAMADGWNSLKSAVSMDIGWLTGPIDGIVGAVQGMVSPIQTAYDTIKPIWDFLFGGGGGGSHGVEGAESDTSGTTSGSFSGGTGGAGGLGGLEVGKRLAPRPVQIPPVIIPAPDTSAYDRVMTELPERLARSMASAVPIASAGGTMIGASLNAGVAPGIQTTIQTFNIFRDTVSAVLSVATANAASGGTAIGQGLSTGVSAGVQSAIQVLNIFAAYVPAALAGAAGAAFSAGANIGGSLASGMQSQIGAVQAAAAALAGAATSATMRALAMASPSKVFVGIGHNVGESLALGMQDRYGLVASSAASLAASTLFDAEGGTSRRSGSGGSSGGGFKNYGIYNEADRYWAPEQTMMGQNIRRGRR